MIRIIVRSDYADMAANVGGAVEAECKTFDVSIPELEAYLGQKLPPLSHRFVIGVETLSLPQHNLPGHDETMAGLSSLTIRGEGKDAVPTPELPPHHGGTP
jgi:hypothetical protein